MYMDFYRAPCWVCGGSWYRRPPSAEPDRNAGEAILRGLDKEAKVVRTGAGFASGSRANRDRSPEARFYSRVSVEDVDEIVEEHLLGGGLGSASCTKISKRKSWMLQLNT